MKISGECFQYTAIDDCTRLRVLGLYPRRTASNAVHFLEHRMIEEFPFPIQRIQTDRGGEFFGMAFQEALQRYCIKFRPTRPRAPHLNGKVERSQQTDLGGVLCHGGFEGSVVIYTSGGMAVLL
jgi:transposase InsO family protein